MSADLFIQKIKEDQCCGCGACAAVCKKKAISMLPNSLGFCYPQVDEERCINCHLCEKVCYYFQTGIKKKPLEVYASASKNKDILQSSTSGGLFTELAKIIILEKGIVFGAKESEADGKIVLKHECVQSEKELIQLNGSKYIQSSVVSAYPKVKKALDLGQKVLFCGTPCQVDGLYGYLQKEYSNLLTVEVVCHGVPSIQIYNDYLNFLKQKYRAHHVRLKFRDKKKNGWAHGAVLIIYRTNGSVVQKRISYKMSSYYMTFMNSQLIRENCYSCKYANLYRSADITLGDYWGIQREHPDVLKENGGILDEDSGISCVCINSEQGKRYFNRCRENLIVYDSTFEKVSRYNQALCSPPDKPNSREEYVRAYINRGYEGIEELYQKQNGKKMWILSLKNLFPYQIRRKILRRLSFVKKY